MTDDVTFIRGYAEGQEWAVTWADEDVLQRVAAGSPTLGASKGRRAAPNRWRADRVLQELTAILFSGPLPRTQVQAFWKKALPDADAASLHDLRFLSGFLAGVRCIAQEPT